MPRVTWAVFWSLLLFLCAQCWTCATAGNVTTPLTSFSTPVKTPQCTRSVQDLISVFKERNTWNLNTSVFQEDSLLHFSIQYSLAYLSYAVYYSYPNPGQGDQGQESEHCCALSDSSQSSSNCKAFVNHRKKVYQVLPGALVFLFGSPMYIILGPGIFNNIMAMAMRRFCWSVPPFCEDVSTELSEAILEDFTLIIPNLVNDAQPLGDVDSGFVEKFFTPRWSEADERLCTLMWPAIFLYVLAVGAPIVVLPWILKAITKYGRRVSFSMKHSGLVNIAVTTAMIHSWVWTLYLYSVHIAVINLYERHLRSDPSHLPEYTMPHTYYGFYSFITLGLIFVIEFPFLFWIIIKSPLIYSKRPAGPLCMISWLLRTLGWIGVVYFLQIMTHFIIFFTLFLFTAPLSAITSMSLFLLLILSCATATGTAFTIVVSFVTGSNKTRRAVKSVWKLFYLVAVFVSSFMVGGLLFVLLSNKDGPTFNSRAILSSVLASGLVGGCLYAMKIVVLKHFVAETADLNDIEKMTYTDE